MDIAASAGLAWLRLNESDAQSNEQDSEKVGIALDGSTERGN
jgi:hypothetical protein